MSSQIKEIACHLAKAGGLGFVVGSIVGAMSFSSKRAQRSNARKLVGGEANITVEHLEVDPCFMQSLVDIYPLRNFDPPRSQTLFNTMVSSADSIVKCYLQLNHPATTKPGVLQFRMHRYMVQLQDAAKAFERSYTAHAASTGGAVVYHALPEQLKAMQACADNYIFNACLYTPHYGAAAAKPSA